jgi:acetyl esterase/lipase
MRIAPNIVSRRFLLLGTLAAGLAARAGAAPPPGPLLPEPDEWLDLWPGAPPGMPSPPPAEEVRERSTDPSFNDRAMFHIRRPRLAIFRPARPNGAAVLLTPGGSYARVVMDKEGFETARWLAARGVTAFVLFYRLAVDHWASGADTSIADARRAMRLVRGRMPAGAKVAILGFSAGGHVAADLVARFEPEGRPDAAGLLYPVIAMSGPAAHAESRLNLLGPDAGAEDERSHDPARNVRADSPPCFLVHAEDDPVIPVANSLLMRDALRARGIATETHLFPDGGHGFGIRLAQGHSVAIWPELFFAWGRRQGLWP